MTTDTLNALCSNLSEILHAAAQPLTILRASFYEGSTDRMTLEDLREQAARSAREIERVCVFFGFLQELAQIESNRPQLSPTELAPLVDHVVEGVGLLFAKERVHISVNVPSTCGFVLVDPERTSRALLSILLIAHSVSRPTDSVELIASDRNSAIQLIVRNARGNGDAMKVESRIGMNIAQTNFESQRAVLSWCPQPFGVLIELQKALPEHKA
jgi:hypothetical protein